MHKPLPQHSGSQGREFEFHAGLGYKASFGLTWVLVRPCCKQIDRQKDKNNIKNYKYLGLREGSVDKSTYCPYRMWIWFPAASGQLMICVWSWSVPTVPGDLMPSSGLCRHRAGICVVHDIYTGKTLKSWQGSRETGTLVYWVGMQDDRVTVETNMEIPKIKPSTEKQLRRWEVCCIWEKPGCASRASGHRPSTAEGNVAPNGKWLLAATDQCEAWLWPLPSKAQDHRSVQLLLLTLPSRISLDTDI